MEMDDKTINLIIGRLSNTNSAADDSALQQWLDENPKNQTEFDKYARLWEQSEGLTPFPKIDVEAQWKIFHGKHFKKEAKVIRLNWWQYAAAAVLILGLFMGTYLSGSSVYETGSFERQQISLADGSTVTLKENTQLKVPRTFNWFARKLELEGTAFFDVAKNPEKPFEIKSDLTTTKVLGTQFKNTATQQLNELEVTEGKVAYWSVNTNDTLILTVGEKGVLKGSALTEKLITRPNANSWKSGVFSFEEKPLLEVLQSLQDYYVFDLAPNEVMRDKTCSFTGSFEQQPLEEVLEELKLVMGMQYQFENGVLKLFNVACQ